jgi:phage gp45-like
MDRETAHQIRGVVSRGVITGSNDNGESQTVDVKIFDGIERQGVEVLQPFGIASRGPKKDRKSVV